MLGCHSMPRSAGYGKGSEGRSSHQSLSKRGVRTVQPRSRCSRLVVMAQGETVLVGDIGGTNARLSLWTADASYSSSSELFAKTYPTADHRTFDHVMGVFLKEAKDKGAAPSSAALAIAGAVVDNRCSMTNVQWIVDGGALEKQYGIKVQLLNDFEAVGYGIPVLEEEDVVFLNRGMAQPKAPKIVMGPGTGLGAAQLFWDDALEDYRVWPGEGSHASFAPRGWKQYALGLYAAGKLGGHVEVEQVACGSGLELIYEFLLTDEPANRQDVNLGLQHAKTAAEISKAALSTPCEDILACEAVDILMAIVGAEAGAMALRCIARGGVYIAGGITPRLLTRLQNTPSGGGSLLEGFLCRDVRDKFKDILQTIPLAVITNGKVGQIGARQVACTILKRGRRDH